MTDGMRQMSAGRLRVRAVRLVVLPIVVLAVIMLGGCGRIAGFVEPVSLFNPVWATDGWVYYLREVSSDGAEVWRQRPDQSNEERVFGRPPQGSVCEEGVLSFLFAGADGDLGVAIECGWDRTELLSYSPNDKKFEPLALTRFLGGAVLANGDGRGYVQAPRKCGIAIGALADGKASEFPSPVTVGGTTFNVSGGDSGCESVVLVRSPATAGDRLYFMTAPDSLGRLPLRPEVDPEDFTWYLTEWDGKSATARFLTKLPGMADLAVSPDGRSMIAAVGSTEDKSGVWSVDLSTGKKTKIVDDEIANHPSFSPDGKRFVYVEKFQHLKFAAAP
ncbi:TolB family protein [Micromonospora sp. I033]